MVLTYGVLWFVIDPHNFVARPRGVVYLVIILLIQRAEYRETQAIHAKLDELLHAQTRADNGLTHIIGAGFLAGLRPLPAPRLGTVQV